ncbi:MAG: PaaI family thioesterase [Myxococcota bacterium]|jgi:acyl-coenzyme A thioesterase PaaI-like protein|nr:PaaI family thioesterase [Myxococcota bacterium]
MPDEAVQRVELDPLTFGAEQQCYGCGPNNPEGLRLRFAREGDSVVTTFTARSGLDGPPGILHGGLQATLCDEVAGWALVGLLGKMGFTTSMNVRYMRPVRLEVPVEVRAKIASHEGAIVTLKVTLSQQGKVGCMARVSYALPSLEAAEHTLQQPMDPAWRHLFDHEEGGGDDPQG